jgi:hypothetical protein
MECDPSLTLTFPSILFHNSSAAIFPSPNRSLPALCSGISLLHQTQTIKKMKAKSIIIAAVLSLQVSFLLAGNNETESSANNESSFVTISTLAPVTPGEATFEETTFTSAFVYNVTYLAPVTPVEADFSDVVPEKNIDLTILAPITPSEADFSDNIVDQVLNLSALVPVTPAEADFE